MIRVAADRAGLLRRLTTVLSLIVLVIVGAVVGGLAAGYRPVVILTGSMGDTAPPGSLIVAAPLEGDEVGPGQILTMRRPGSAPVTHRVIEVETNGNHRFAITQGDANEAPDATPHPLDGEQLVARWIVPRLGGWATTVFRPGLVLGLVGLAVLVVAVGALRRIWARGPEDLEESEAPAREVEAESELRSGARRIGRPRLATAVVPVVILGTAGVAWALATANAPVTANVFGTSDCFDPELASVQSGETVHAVSGTVSEPITAVDPTRSFVVASARSSANEPADASVTVELGAGGTAVDLSRVTDAGSPPAITVAWSVVSYACGITVQRGTVSGDGTSQLDVPITAVDTAASFVLVSSAPEATATTFGANDLFIGELADPSTLRIRTTGSTFPAGQTLAWQVVEFDDGGDLAVQVVGTTLGLGATSDTIALPTPVDPGTTFLIASAASASTGPDIGERLVRTHLVDGSTVAVDRGVGGEAIEVLVQVVTLKDGSTVRHGTVDLAPAQPAATVDLVPFDPARATAFSTVAQPGVSAGGLTDQVADDVPGEANATFLVLDQDSISVTRGATASNASFGWQVVEWAGPTWWDTDWNFRQRIDVETAATAAPGAYSVPLTVDHAALVASGLARADGDDVRVLRWDGTTWTELDRVLDDDSTWNDVATTLWFRTTTPIAADTVDSYWLYLGNGTPAGPPPADPEAVFLLTEDFESGTLGDFEDRTAGTGWYQALPWTRRLPVTVPAGTVAADLVDFPMLVSLTSADLAATALADGSDIRFTAGDGVTPLPHEIERFDPATGSLAAWVLVPTVTVAADTDLFLYYGADDAPDQQDIRATWPADIEAAWHLARDPAGSAPQLDDSTIANHDGLSGGAMTTGDRVVGAAGWAADLDGVDDVLRADPFDVAGSPGLTVSALVRLDATPAEATIVAKASGPGSRILELAVTATGDLVGRLSLGGAVAELQAGTVPTGSWHHLAMTWDGATQRLFVDGVEVGSQPASGSIDGDPTMAVTLGDLVTGGAPLDGLLDEVRVEPVARPQVWLAAAALNQRTPGSFHTVGPVEAGTWLDQGTWSARKRIVAESDLVASDQIDYPLLVHITDAELASSATLSGRDLIFTAADGTTRLDHVVESWSKGTGVLTAWVRLPIFSATSDTELFLYYGNPSAGEQEDPAAVFGPGADLVLTGSP